MNNIVRENPVSKTSVRDTPVLKNIHVLDDETINQIAAGEVVERPASVVKELVENSVDAGAGHIRVDISSDKVGITRIRVVDDGFGMQKDDAMLSFTRHATSKVTEIGDLVKVRTMGFRGEALASIAGVSKVTMITKPPSTQIISGTKIVISGGEVIEVSEIGSPDGTSVMVENLFFNTPARKKFMKSRQTEMAHIYRIMEHIALANDTVSFQLFHNGKEKPGTTGSGSLSDVIREIYGSDLSKDLISVSGKTPFMQIDGFIGKPGNNKTNSQQIIVSINNRFITSYPIVRAVKAGYGTLLPKNRYPVAFISIRIDTALVDVNVHPTKKEVKLSREKEITAEVISAVSGALRSGSVLSGWGSSDWKRDWKSVSPKNVKSPEETPVFGVGKSPLSTEKRSERSEENNNDWKPLFSGKTVIPERDAISGVTSPAPVYSSSVKDSDKGFGVDKQPYHPRFSATDTQLRLSEVTPECECEKNLLPPMEVIGQVDSSYIIAKTKGEEELLIIDQHAAHERILYDQICKKRDSGSNSQELIVPVLMNLRPREGAILKEAIPDLEVEGFSLEEFGKDTYAVRAVPMVLGKRLGTELVEDIITDLMDGDLNLKSVDERKEKITSTIACRAAIKAGAVLSHEQMSRLTEQLSRTEMPYTCPHGRPTIITFPRKKLDFMFKRT